MNKLNVNKVLLATTILLVLVLGGFLGWQMWARNDSYYAVLTLGGDLFFGKMHSFPSSRLTDVWTLQRNQDEKNPVSLVKFDQSYWGPEDVLYLNKKNIIWKTKLREDSQILSQIKNPSKQQIQQPQVPSENIINN